MHGGAPQDGGEGRLRRRRARLGRRWTRSTRTGSRRPRSASSRRPARRSSGTSRRSASKDAKLLGELKAGDVLTVDKVFKLNQRIDVSGVTKGRGFAGVMKRWNMKGAARDSLDRARAPPPRRRDRTAQDAGQGVEGQAPPRPLRRRATSPSRTSRSSASRPKERPARHGRRPGPRRRAPVRGHRGEGPAAGEAEAGGARPREAEGLAGAAAPEARAPPGEPGGASAFRGSRGATGCQPVRSGRAHFASRMCLGRGLDAGWLGRGLDPLPLALELVAHRRVEELLPQADGLRGHLDQLVLGDPLERRLEAQVPRRGRGSRSRRARPRGCW